MITRRMMGQVGSAPGRVGAGGAPDACWSIPGFTEAHAQLFPASREVAAQFAAGTLAPEVVAQIGCEGLTESECTDHVFDLMRTELINAYECGGTGTRVEPIAGQPCNSYHNRLAVQIILANGGYYTDILDGIWGKNSAAALKASGKTFEQLAPGCTPPAPSYGGGGGTPGPGPGGGGGDLTNVDAKEPASSSSNMWLYGLGAVVLGLGAAVVITRKKQPYAKNPIDLGDLDGDQRSLFQELDLIATNDGDAYRNRDAKLAVDRAWRELRRSKDAALREDYRVVRNHVVKSVASNWNRW